MANPVSPAEAAVLEKLLLGQLPPDQVERLATQYADSGQLEELARSLSGNDTFLEAIKNQSTSVDPADESLAEKLVSRLSAALSRRDDTIALPAGAVDDAEAAPETLEYFRIEKVLGEGGMGTVYLAEDTRLGRKVAIKTLKKEIAKRAGAKERFFREAKTAAKLDHDNVIPIHYVGESQGVPFLAMPFLKGRPLDEQLKQSKGRMPVPEIIRIGRETALGLAAAHEAGLIHRDIKPANIWLESPNGRVKILDFGLARSQGEEANLTASGMVLGTPAYMAPEQARGLPVDARADFFSLGVMLYEMAAGKKPFTGPDVMAILTSLALDNPPLVSTINPAVPPKLADLIARLMAKEPGRRPMSATAVADELAQLAVQISRPTIELLPEIAPAADPWGGIDDSASPTEATPLPRAEARPAKRGPNKLLLLGGSLFGLLVIIAGIVVIVRDKDGKKIAEITVPDGGKAEIVDDGKPKPAPVTKDADRKAAEYVLSLGGMIQINGNNSEIRSLAELPKFPFELTTIHLRENPKVSDAGLMICAECKHLTTIQLSRTTVSDIGLAHFKNAKQLENLFLDYLKTSDKT